MLSTFTESTANPAPFTSLSCDNERPLHDILIGQRGRRSNLQLEIAIKRCGNPRHLQ
jgi:hypothetical protein